jgi:predicted ATPase
MAMPRATSPTSGSRGHSGLTSFVGRAADLAALDERVSRSRLVTLLGPPGTGKTRLAIEYAKRQAASLSGGTWFCELASAQSAEAVVVELARTLDVSLPSGVTAQDRTDALGAALRERNAALVILDNFEQVADHAARTLGVWLGAAQSVRFLVTSRRRLNLAGEHVFDLGPLSLPGSGVPIAQSEAVELFVARACAVRNDFALTPDNERSVGALVCALDGLPLAIELCAARVRVQSPVQLLERMGRRFELLRGDAGTAGLWEAIESSWNLLSPNESQALAACSVFRGSFDLDACEAVIGAAEGEPWPMDVLHALVDSSLVAIYETIAVGRGELLPSEHRFFLYDAIRNYAAQMLARSGALADVERRHANYFVHVGGSWAERVKNQGSIVALKRLTRERENLLAAYHWARDHNEGPLALEAALAIVPLLLAEGPLGLGIELLDEARALPGMTPLPPSLHARYLEARISIMDFVSDPAARRSACGEGLALATELGDRALQARMHFQLGHVMMAQNDTAAALSQYDAALRLYQATGNRRGEGEAYGVLGNVWYARERYDEATRYYERALASHRASGDRLLQGAAMFQLGAAALEAGRLTEAREHFACALEPLEEVGDLKWIARTIGFAALVDLEEGRFAEARAALERAVRASRNAGALRNEAVFLAYLGNCLLADDLPQDALVAYDEALRMMAEIEHPLLALFLGFSAAARAVMGDATRAHEAIEAAKARAAFGDEKNVNRNALLFLAGIVDLAVGNAEHSADPVKSESLRAAARARLSTALPQEQLQSDVRFARRLLVRALEAARLIESASQAPAERAASPERVVAATLPPEREAASTLPTDVLVVARSGLWFQPPGGRRVKLHRRRALRRIVEALVLERERAPGTALPLPRLVEAGWPGERIHAEAAADRAYFAVATLRRMGLRGFLVTLDDGYALAPTAPVCVADDDANK